MVSAVVGGTQTYDGPLVHQLHADRHVGLRNENKTNRKLSNPRFYLVEFPVDSYTERPQATTTATDTPSLLLMCFLGKGNTVFFSALVPLRPPTPKPQTRLKQLVRPVDRRTQRNLLLEPLANCMLTL